MRAGDEQAVFLAKILKERYGINTMGIYLDSSSRSLGRHLLDKYLGWYSYNKEDHKKARQECRETGFATITTAGYDEYYLIPKFFLPDYEMVLPCEIEMQVICIIPLSWDKNHDESPQQNNDNYIKKLSFLA